MFVRLIATVMTAVPLLAACASPAPIVDTAPAATPHTINKQGAQARCTVPAPAEKLRVALEELLKGPNEAERAYGLSSVFSHKSAGALNGVSAQNGRVIIDLKDLSASLSSAGTSAGTHQLLNELGRTIAQFKANHENDYRLDGSCEAFWYWLQGECHAVAASEYR